MNVEKLAQTPAREWPSEADAVLLQRLQDQDADPSQRMMAAEMAGSLSVLNDDLARALAGLIRNPDEPDELRATAAIALGPILEDLDMGFYDDDLTEAPVSPETGQMVRDTLHQIHQDEGAPKEVRRRALEASVRASQEWHAEAVGEAYRSDDLDWQVTAVFCMGHLPGFDTEILESLESDEPRLRFEAVQAAGHRSLADAWPHIRGIIRAPDDDLDLLFAAIEAAASVRPEEAEATLSPFLDSDDEELAEMAHAAIEFAGVLREDADPDYAPTEPEPPTTALGHGSGGR